MRFRLNRELPYGDTLCLVGSTDYLGAWQPPAAPPFEWTANHFWTIPVPSPTFCAPTRFEFKVCVRTADGSHVWEPGPNHVVELPLYPQPNYTLDLRWGHPAEYVIPDTKSNGSVSPNQSVLVASPPPTPAGHTARGTPVFDPLSIAAARVAAVANNGSPAPEDLEPLTFRIKYHVAEGERMYLLGSIPELGAWNKLHSPRMQPIGSDFFAITVLIPRARITSTFEYKYFTRSSNGKRRWEQIVNRVALPSDKVLDRLWDDRWESTRLDFSIYYPATDTQIMHITGDLPEIGAWFKPGPIPMRLGPMQMLETEVKGRKWRLSVWVDPDVELFSYRYILVDTASKQELWEREPNRNSTEVAKKATVNSEMIFRDVNFVSKLMFDRVPPDMFIGPYPQTPLDIDLMAKAGVTGVFNVQTDEDFEHRAIQWPLLLERYMHHGIKVVRHPIKDFDRESLRAHLHKATEDLERLIKEGKKVYIHCTAGMGRAPACAVSYLCWVQGMELEDAVAYVKKYRTVAVPNVPVLREALKDAY